MLALKDIRQYISDLKIAEDDHVYIGKLDAKQDKSIGVYPRPGRGQPVMALGGRNCSSYDIKRISLLIHWNRSVGESEAAANKLYDELLNETSLMIGNTHIQFLILQVPEPVNVGTDDKGIYEYVIELDFYYRRLVN